MMTRRAFTTLLAGAAAVPALPAATLAQEAAKAATKVAAKDRAPRAALYVSVGPDLTLYGISKSGAELSPVQTVSVPAPIQYVWRHPKQPWLFVASSNRFFVPGSDDKQHHVTTFAMDRRTGRLTQLGEPRLLPSRPINITVDATGSWLLIAYNGPSSVTVHPIGPKGAVGEAVAQANKLDTGVYAHQIRMLPSNRAVALITRGNDPTATKPEDPGAIKLLDFKKGQLSDAQSVAPNGGIGFGPRHVDFHPSQPWMYAALERGNKLQMYKIYNDRLSEGPLYSKEVLADPGTVRPGQVAGAIHVHPNGRFVYLSNRADGTVEANGRKIFVGGENSIAVFAIDGETGEPTRIQNRDLEGYHARTFSIDPAGRMLVAATVLPMNVRDGDGVKVVPATLSTFAIGKDGMLTQAGRLTIDTAKGPVFWCGFVPLG